MQKTQYGQNSAANVPQKKVKKRTQMSQAPVRNDVKPDLVLISKGAIPRKMCGVCPPTWSHAGCVPTPIH